MANEHLVHYRSVTVTAGVGWSESGATFEVLDIVPLLSTVWTTPTIADAERQSFVEGTHRTMEMTPTDLLNFASTQSNNFFMQLEPFHVVCYITHTIHLHAHIET